MKFTPFLCAALVAVLSHITMPAHAADAAKARKPAATKAGKSQLLHVVSFKFKDSASKEDIKKVEEAFRALKTKIPQIKKLVWGLNNSPEKHNKGCTHAWILTFNSDADRDAYLVHPDHQEFGKLVGPTLADVFVVDFWTKE
jgi:hypothetical protein